MTLNDISKPGVLLVTGISVTGSLRQRLYDMGVCPGTKIDFIRTAPLTDPIQVRIGGYHVALRRSEAIYVEVSQDVQ